VCLVACRVRGGGSRARARACARLTASPPFCLLARLNNTQHWTLPPAGLAFRELKNGLGAGGRAGGRSRIGEWGRVACSPQWIDASGGIASLIDRGV
jgi:hypothetical protein